MIRHILQSAIVATVSALGRPASGAAVVPGSLAEQVPSPSNPKAGMMERAMVASLCSGDGVKAEMQKLREADRGITEFGRIPGVNRIWEDLPPEIAAEARRSYEAWAREH